MDRCVRSYCWAVTRDLNRKAEKAGGLVSFCKLRPVLGFGSLWTVLACWMFVGCSPQDALELDPPAPTAAKPVASDSPNPAEVAVQQGQGQSEVPARVERIESTDLKYLGAFRLPGPSGGSNWEYSGYAMTYFPQGDPRGPDDGFPGSIFAVGHDHHQMVSEVSIPGPVKSLDKRVADLPVASTLQPFADVRDGRFGELEIPRAGLEYLPNKNGGSGKLHFCWGQHFQFERDPSHGWCDLTLNQPRPVGPWRLANYTNYVTNDYLFEIPADWASRHLPGFRLVTGRFRDGRWGGLGPALLAYAPPSSQKASEAAKVKPLLMYGRPQGDSPELEVNDQQRMKGFSESDEWSGGAWLTRGERQSVILVGTKAIGATWYGFSNGVVYPISGDPNDPIPEVPAFPHDARGWWSKDIEAQIIFFEVRDLLRVAKGDRDSWTPQPFASLNINQHLFEPGYDHQRQKRYSLGACCFDRERGRLFVAERQVQQDEERTLIHVFQVN